MSKSTINISIKRNVAVWSLLTVLVVLGSLYYYYSYVRIPVPSSDELVKIKSDSLPMVIPAELQATLASMGITGIAMVDKDNTLRLMSPDGTPRNLCGSQSKTDINGESECDVATSPKSLLSLMSASGDCGLCDTGAGLADCRKATNLWTCASPRFSCASTCQ